MEPNLLKGQDHIGLPADFSSLITIIFFSSYMPPFSNSATPATLSDE